MNDTNPLTKFFFKCEPEASRFVEDIAKSYIQKSPFLQQLEKELLEKTSSKLYDWIDYLEVEEAKEIETLGFQKDPSGVFRNHKAQLPGVLVGTHQSMAIAVDSIDDFLMVRGITRLIDGPLLGGFRSCLVATENGVQVLIVERRSYVPTLSAGEKVLQAIELWKTRPRGGDENAALDQAIQVAAVIVQMIGKPMAATVACQGERDYWQTRNRAAQVQKARQDSLGMGWANHDHHTFRSSREYFKKTIQLFETLGFTCRERFYAGSEAGWGAQVMEHPDIRLVLFIDVDLSPEELQIDFAHTDLPSRDRLGTVGLWCALHGESILEAGMHHLEAQFLFQKLREDLAASEVKMMDPFSNFAYLKQAFTVGERWKVKPERIQKLLDKKLITSAQAEQFTKEGAIGSHLENLERHDGFKGFNQKAVSDIIARTNPLNPNLQLGA